MYWILKILRNSNFFLQNCFLVLPRKLAFSSFSLPICVLFEVSMICSDVVGIFHCIFFLKFQTNIESGTPWPAAEGLAHLPA